MRLKPSIIAYYKYGDLEGLEFLVETLDGEAHNVEVAAVDGGYADVAYPFLNAVCPCLVEGLETVNIIVDFLLGKALECYISYYGETLLLLLGGKTHACNNMVRPATKH